MATLTTAEKAPILGPDGEHLGITNVVAYDVQTSDPAVVAIAWEDWHATAVAQGEGTAVITATRLSDGASDTLDIEVVAVVLDPFTITLGTPVPK